MSEGRVLYRRPTKCYDVVAIMKDISLADKDVPNLICSVTYFIIFSANTVSLLSAKFLIKFYRNLKK